MVNLTRGPQNEVRRSFLKLVKREFCEVKVKSRLDLDEFAIERAANTVQGVVGGLSPV